MNFIHSREHLNAGDMVELQCDTECNFLLTTDGNFADYKSGRAYRYYGGHFTRFPAYIEAPNSGYWNITIDLGGGRANIRYSLNVIRK